MLDSKVTRSTQYESLTGIVERLTYHSQESGYSVARLKAVGNRDLITIVGSFANLQAGQTLLLTGVWREHPKYGAQFQVRQYQETKPATITGIEKYLGSGLIKGVGPITAKRIVAFFGLETLDIIETQIERLIEVPGIARKRVKMIQAAWATQKAIKEVMVFLQGHGVSTTYAVKIYKQYSDKAVEIVTNNPYQLATDIYGIGFVTADAIARNLGIAPGSEYRYRSGIIHVLGEAAEDGHCFLPQAELIEQVVQRLSLKDYKPSPQTVKEIMFQMGLEDLLVMQGHREHEFIYYQPAFYYSEQAISLKLHQLLSHPHAVDLPRVQVWIEKYAAATNMQLSQSQQIAVQMAASKRVLILA